ncbi:MAG: hypothetical protein E7554_06055 [Ruminococcaceae bacterium]|nr:hypothetical protein [Oscillospiraceae bacterium]
MSDIRSFLDTVSRQIRWKRARAPLTVELENHIIDRTESLTESGISPVEAEAQAVREMGDPEDIGLALDRVHRPSPNWGLLGCAAALLLSGMALMWALGDRGTYFQPMLIYSALGIAALIVGYFLDYTLLAGIPGWGIFAVCGVLMYLPILGNHFMTAAAQLCHMLPVLFIPLVYRTRSGEKKDIIVMLAAFIACQLAAGFSHQWMSLSVYMIVVCGGLVIYAALNGWFRKRTAKTVFGAFAPPAAMFALLCTVSFSSLERRLMEGALFPEDDPMGMGWVALRVRELIGTSQFIGSGDTSELMESFLQPGELRSVNHLLAVAVHEYGYILLIILGALLCAAGAMLVRGVRRQSCGLGKLTMLCIGLCFGLRTAFYLLCNLGFTFITFEGIPLFSYCGKLTVIDMFMLGILLSVFRTESITRDSGIKLRIPSPKSHTA